MGRYFSLLLVFASLPFYSLQAQISERKGSQARSYAEIIAGYQFLADAYPNAQLLELGPSDAGRPLHLFVMQAESFLGDQTLKQMAEGKLVVLVNNGIHPGESCGMDASLEWSAEVLKTGGVAPQQLWAIIPVYNIGGSLQARPHTRANQNGPDLQGFRGNARNLDLNRDFIKGDALNTKNFWALYQALRPQIFVDTHTSNGADYPYTMTLISTQSDKIAPSIRNLLYEDMEPYLYRSMEKRGWEMIPYVNVHGKPPHKGYSAFLETPRYASGYTALFHSIGFITEAHMFKPYSDRVEATHQFLETLAAYCAEHAAEVKAAYQAALSWEAQSTTFPIAWELDSSRAEALDFKAYPYRYEESTLGDYQRLKYSREKEESLALNYYPRYRATASAAMPKYYVVPQAWNDVVLRLQYHGIEMQPLAKDTLLELSTVYLEKWEHGRRPYEGHFRTEVQSVRRIKQERLFYAGDYLVPADQGNRYFLASVLDPMSVDSYLSWGFFDIIFQQKEYFSAYVFEDRAMEMLAEDSALAEEFEAWKEAYPKALSEPYAVLSFFYERSEYYEKEHLRYPIGFIE